MRRVKTDLRRQEKFRRVFEEPPRPGTPRTRSPSGPPLTAPTGDRLVRNGGAMAVGTIVSRATGFLRTAVLLAALGRTGVADAYNAANASPNNVYDLLLGGVLTAVIVPLLVRAARTDADGGARFTSVLFTLTGLFIGIASIVGVFAAPLIIGAYFGGNSADERSLAVTFTRLFLPQMLFYAMTALMGAVLNTKGRFGAVGFAPVVNNVIVIVTGALFIATADRGGLDDTLGHTETLLLGLGTTAGVIGMTIALLPAMRGVGIHLRFVPDFREPRLRLAAQLGGWVLVYAAVNQLGLLVITRLATGGPHKGDFTLYSTAYQIFQLPHAIIAVSVISALMPGLAAAADDQDVAGVRSRLSRGLRLTFVFLVPAALGLAALANPIVTAALQHGSTTPSAGRVLADTLAVFAIGLPAFSAFQLLLRAFYARQDSRTPALINVAVNVVNVVGDIVLIAVLPSHLRVPALAAGLALSYVVGTGIAFVLLRTSLDGVDGARVLRLLVRTTVAAFLGAVVARAVADIVRNGLGSGVGGAIVAMGAGATLGGLLYVWAARRMRVRELTDLLRVVRGGR